MTGVLARCASARSLPFVIAALCSNACAYPIEAGEEGELASSTQALWEVGTDRETDEWDSGMTNNLATAFDVKYDTTNGKIRRAKLTCRPLSDD